MSSVGPAGALIAVTGATGEVGSRVVTRLAERGATQRLVVRDPGRAPRDPPGEIRQASGYGALQGADTVFLIPAAEAADRVEQHIAAVDAAVEAGVRRIVYLSWFGAGPEATFTLARDHWHTEEHIRASGVDWAFLRMNLYMDFIPTMVAADGTIRGPAGDGTLAAVLRDDVAAAAVSVLISEEHLGRSLVPKTSPSHRRRTS
jgi:uncharacterized protein YbjT (DUF2867 family)